MRLTNYWLQLIWLFVGGFLCSYFPKRQERLCGDTVRRWNLLPALILVVPYIIWAGFRPNGFGDTGIYRQGFLESGASLGDAVRILLSDQKDPGFYALRVLIKMVIGNQDVLFFLLLAAFQMLCLMLVYRRYSDDYWLCIFLFVASTDYMSWVFNGVRQFIAATMIFAGMGLLLKKRYFPLILLILAASTMHGSALLMLPVVFIVQGKAWNSKTLLTLAATAVVIVFVDQFTPILNDLLQDTQYDDVITNEIWTNDDGTNMIRVLVYSVPALLSLFGLRYVREANNPVINICVNCSIVTMALYLVAAVSSGIYIGRLPIYTSLHSYIALPWLIDHIFDRRSAQLVRLLTVLLFCVFFYIQMFITWNL